jgi:hypothetical protein
MRRFAESGDDLLAKRRIPFGSRQTISSRPSTHPHARNFTQRYNLVESLVMADIKRAEPKDAPCLADLYSKVLEKTGFKAWTAPERRAELIAWLESLCRDGKLLFVSDDQGPISLGHYDREKGEVVAIVTRDGMERQGYGAAILEEFASAHPTLRLRPFTRGGRALAEKCGFSASKDDASVWGRAPQCHK